MTYGISISQEEAIVRIAIRGFANPFHSFGGETYLRQKRMNDSTKQQLDAQNPATLKTLKKRGRFKSLFVVASLCVLIVGIYLLRSALFPNYLGIVVALCVVACGLFLVRGVIRLMAEQDSELMGNESKTLLSGANVAGQETDNSKGPSEIEPMQKNSTGTVP
jgi:hypothetical protein